ncbi:ribonuclease H-like domain-containing protein [Russula compacta]|nr:ribonuclease H-like domain-containing protein [Russula compacta]
MPPTKGPLWKFFYTTGEKQNKSHYKAYCLGCVSHHASAKIPLNANGDPDIPKVKEKEWFKEACIAANHIWGEKGVMIAHLVGTNPCRYTTSAAKKVARELHGGKDAGSDADDENGEEAGPSRKKRKLFSDIEKTLTQMELKVYKGITIPFSDKQIVVVKNQFLLATVSANLPFRWTEDPEVIKLFLLFQSHAFDVIPSRKTLAGHLLDEQSSKVEQKLQQALKGRYHISSYPDFHTSSDSWKDSSKNSINGVNISVDFKSYLIDLIKTNGDKKDGPSMCKVFSDMIDKAEKDYELIVVCFCCDNDGGSQAGQKLLIIARPWIFGPPCCAHQFQLTLGDYFKESPKAANGAANATEVIGWILNHQCVRAIFDEAQSTKNDGTVLAYLVANLTRWTTHFVAFNHLYHLKVPLHQAVILNCDEIVSAQVGAEKNRRTHEKLTGDANKNCDLIESTEFWTTLKTIIDDIEPICYGTNINQSDGTHPNQVLLTFAGIYLHFNHHPNRTLAVGMKKRIEKWWKALDQPMFVFALILNPYQRLDHFGEKVGANVFTLNTLLMELYHRVKLRPPPCTMTNEEIGELVRQKVKKEWEVSAAFLKYIAGTGTFQLWESNQDDFEKAHGDNPILVWEQLKLSPEVAELADLAILLLSLVVNQARNERDFSDLKIKKT